jgi:hypothetical protein
VNLFHFVMTGGLSPSRGRAAPCKAQGQNTLQRLIMQSDIEPENMLFNTFECDKNIVSNRPRPELQPHTVEVSYNKCQNLIMVAECLSLTSAQSCPRVIT